MCFLVFSGLEVIKYLEFAVMWRCIDCARVIRMNVDVAQFAYGWYRGIFCFCLLFLPPDGLFEGPSHRKT